MPNRRCWLLAALLACCACQAHDDRRPAPRDQPQPAQPAPSAADRQPGVQNGVENGVENGVQSAVQDSARAAAAAREAMNQAMIASQRAQETVDQISKELVALEAQLDQLAGRVASAVTDADRAAVQAQLTEIARQRGELQQRITAAKAAAAEAQRARGAALRP
jgi:chromosome segregation ATPase